jgi:hypothetical protein
MRIHEWSRVLCFIFKKENNKGRETPLNYKNWTHSHTYVNPTYAQTMQWHLEDFWSITFKIDDSQLQYDKQVILHLVSFVLQNSPLA